MSVWDPKTGTCGPESDLKSYTRKQARRKTRLQPGAVAAIAALRTISTSVPLHMIRMKFRNTCARGIWGAGGVCTPPDCPPLCAHKEHVKAIDPQAARARHFELRARAGGFRYLRRSTVRTVPGWPHDHACSFRVFSWEVEQGWSDLEASRG